MCCGGTITGRVDCVTSLDVRFIHAGLGYIVELDQIIGPCDV